MFTNLDSYLNQNHCDLEDESLRNDCYMQCHYLWLQDTSLHPSLIFRTWCFWIVQLPQLIVCTIQISVKSPKDILSRISKMESLFKVSCLQKYKERPSGNSQMILASREETMKIMAENDICLDKDRFSTGHSSFNQLAPNIHSFRPVAESASAISIEDGSINS